MRSPLCNDSNDGGLASDVEVRRCSGAVGYSTDRSVVVLTRILSLLQPTGWT